MGYLIENKKKSSTIKSYISAIRSVLAEDGVILNDNKSLLTSLTKARRLKNDKVQTRLPIQKGVLKILLNTTKEHFREKGQIFLEKLYRALFVSAYFGLLRVGELTYGPHAILAKNVNIGENKNKVLFILESSKTHGRERKPQLIKISSRTMETHKHSQPKGFWSYNKDTICAYSIIREFLRVRPIADNKQEQFFVYADRSPVHPHQMRVILRKLLALAGFKSNLYNTHSFRIGRCCDLLKMGFDVPTIQKIGRWQSNAIYTYLR